MMIRGTEKGTLLFVTGTVPISREYSILFYYNQSPEDNQFELYFQTPFINRMAWEGNRNPFT
jgi:hypothetical protein